MEQLLVNGEKEQTTTRTNTGVLRCAQNDKRKNKQGNSHGNYVKNF
jgi:hypothetical protein